MTPKERKKKRIQGGFLMRNNRRIKLNTIKLNENNPRVISQDKFKKLVNSIKGLPIMLKKLRKILVDEDNVIISGNMRYRAIKELGFTETDIDIFTREDSIENNRMARELDPDYKDKTYEEQRRELIIKDNLEFGDNDWDLLSEQYEKEELKGWGMDVDKNWGEEFKGENSEIDTDELGKDLDLECPKCHFKFKNPNV